MVELLTPLVRRWKLLASMTLGAASLTAVYSLLVPSVFTAATTFTPEVSASTGLPGSLAGLVGLAGQFGLTPPSGGSVSPDFFASVLRSRELLTTTLRSEFADPRASEGTRVTLLNILRVRAPTESARLAEGVRRLGGLTSASVDRRTGIVTLTVRLRDPRLVADVANHMVELLNDFNLRQRQSQFREQKRFAGERLQQAERELRQAEGELLRFLQSNRQYRGSPLLEFEHDRLERQVQVRQEVFLSLTKAYEDARIAEVRDTPVLTIIDGAVPPVRRTSPRRRLMVMLAALAGLVAAAGLAYVAELRDNLAREERPEYRALLDAVAEAKRQLARIMRRGHTGG